MFVLHLVFQYMAEILPKKPIQSINQSINPIILIDNDYTLPVELKVNEDFEIGVVNRWGQFACI